MRSVNQLQDLVVKTVLFDKVTVAPVAETESLPTSPHSSFPSSRPSPLDVVSSRPRARTPERVPSPSSMSRRELTASTSRVARVVPRRRSSASSSSSSSRRRAAASSARAVIRSRDVASSARAVTNDECEIVRAMCALAMSSEGASAPHPLSACAITDANGTTRVARGHEGQGSTRAEIACVEALVRDGVDVRGGTACVNLEPVHGEVAGETRAVEALVTAGVRRVVVGMLHPLPGLRGRAVKAMRERGIVVDVLDARASGLEGEVAASCRETNEALLYRVATGLPYSVYKYAMTLDGKIATDNGHSSWVTGAEARERVFRERKRADCIVVGGATVRKDNPRLTCREETGFQPARIVLSRTLNLPEDAELWRVRDVAPTIVCTTKGARPEFQKMLRSKGVEVVEFNELTPLEAAKYMHARGFLRCFWECGGGLAAPAMKSGVFHHVMAFVAPKLIGGNSAPTPLGDLGFEAMHDALPLAGVTLETVGRDILVRGYVPNSQSTGALGRIASAGHSVRGLDFHVGESADDEERADEGTLMLLEQVVASIAQEDEVCAQDELPPIKFYKAWDEHGALSNFSPFPVRIDDIEWPTVEHYYQAQKFAGVDMEVARDTYEKIKIAPSPEAAAKIGRSAQVTNPESIRTDWEDVKLEVMHRALVTKFIRHEGPRNLLLQSVCKDGRVRLIEDSPVDMIWGTGRDGSGQNLLGTLLADLREEFVSGRLVAN